MGNDQLRVQRPARLDQFGVTQFTGTMTDDVGSPGEAEMRAEVADSWHRSVAAGVRATDDGAPITLDADALADRREAHPLAAVFPLLDDVLGQAARDCDALMAVADNAAQLLWVCGTPATLRAAERIGFVEGANWDERLAGTNAPGMAMRTGAPASVTRSEHFRLNVQQWSCAASPIHDPVTGQLLGVLDVTGGAAVESPQTLAMVRAAARMAESELAQRALRSSVAVPAQRAPGIRLGIEALGRHEALVSIEDGTGRRSTVRLSPRHSEIVVLLASASRGLSGDELAVLLHAEDMASSTLRAEMNRLRNLLGEELLGSRPYRLTAEIAGDWLGVGARLASGDVGGALGRFGGPLLPRSTAPGITRLRDESSMTLRQALLVSNSADLMSAWTRSSWGSDDYEMWLAQREAIGPHSPLLPLVDGQIARLDAELA